ncbi:MAG TPA: hypothetical protein VNW95_09450 [Mucilaginibacter sp.]|nr:hypothetical protein [Mucilaginibacter sp.]
MKVNIQPGYNEGNLFAALGRDFIENVDRSSIALAAASGFCEQIIISVKVQSDADFNATILHLQSSGVKIKAIVIQNN